MPLIEIPKIGDKVSGGDFACPQCGDPVPELYEGYCELCCRENQTALDRHIAEYEIWHGMTISERDAAVMRAIERA